jgi:hypothetical protein
MVTKSENVGVNGMVLPEGIHIPNINGLLSLIMPKIWPRSNFFCQRKKTDGYSSKTRCH